MYNMQWSVSAVFIGDESFDPNHKEYIYWRSKSYPSWSWISLMYDGWEKASYIRNGTKYGEDVYFLMK